MIGLDICFTSAIEACVLDAIDCAPDVDLSAHVPCGTRADVEVPSVSLTYALPGTAGLQGCGRSGASFTACHWADEADRGYRDDLERRIEDAYHRLQDSWDKVTDLSWQDASKAAAVGGLYNGAMGATTGVAAYGICHAIDHANDAKDVWEAYNDLNNGLDEWERI